MFPNIPPQTAQKVSLWVGLLVAYFLLADFATFVLLAFFNLGIAPWLHLPPMNLGNAFSVVVLLLLALLLAAVVRDRGDGK